MWHFRLIKILIVNFPDDWTVLFVKTYSLYWKLLWWIRTEKSNLLKPYNFLFSFTGIDNILWTSLDLLNYTGVIPSNFNMQWQKQQCAMELKVSVEIWILPLSRLILYVQKWIRGNPRKLHIQNQLFPVNFARVSEILEFVTASNDWRVHMIWGGWMGSDFIIIRTQKPTVDKAGIFRRLPIFELFQL